MLEKAVLLVVVALLVQGFFYVQSELKLSYNKSGKYVWKESSSKKESKSKTDKVKVDVK